MRWNQMGGLRMWVYRTSPKKVEKVQVYHHFARNLLSVFFGVCCETIPHDINHKRETIFCVAHLRRSNEGRVVAGVPRSWCDGARQVRCGFHGDMLLGPWCFSIWICIIWPMLGPNTSRCCWNDWNWIWGSYLYMVKLFRMVNDCILSRFVNHKDFGIRGMVTIDLFEDSEPSNTFN